MKGLGYGKGYAYDHDAPDHFSGQAHRPEAIEGKRYYVPGTLGFEKRIAEWMERIAKKS
jgi:putative ATPase